MKPNTRRFVLALIGLILAAGGSQAAIRPAGNSQDVSSVAGVRWEFKPEGGEWKPINVPAGGWRTQGYTCDAGTYRAELTMPADVAGNIVHLAFSAVNFGADVSAGPDDAHLTHIASHVNGWMPFAADLTPWAVAGKHVLIQVDVKGRRKFMVGGKYTVPEGATWCPGLEEGILRGVALQVLPPVRVEDVFIKTRLAPDTIESLVTVVNDSDRPAKVSLSPRVNGSASPGLPYPHISSTSVETPAHSSRVIDLGSVPWKAGPQSYWWPNVPYRPNYRARRHVLTVAVRVNGTKVQEYRQPFGFRQFRVNGNHYELNGLRCNLRGDNQQEADFGTDAYGVRPGFGPPSATNPGWPQAVENLLRLNFNVMRIHQIPATPYMLDVCDEKGLMLVDESPLRGSEGGEDYKNGRENMLNMDRELVLRDRNHPAIVIWSAANEWSDPIRDAIPVIQQADGTRPIIADGVGDMGPDVINMEHYVRWNEVPTIGGKPRPDRPYGETESVWPNDNTWQGFAWMATGIRIRRLQGDSDLRNYVLNNAWSNYVPGEDESNEILERKVKGMGGEPNIRPALKDPWNHPNIRLMQKCYDPLAVCDVEFDRLNARSNANGDWPTVKPRLQAASHIVRKIAAFNDEFTGDEITLHWQLHQGSKTGTVLAEGQSAVHIAPGGFNLQDIAFDAPKSPGDVFLVLTSSKDNHIRFVEDAIAFSVVKDTATVLADGNYQLLNRNSGLPAEVNSKSTGQIVQGAMTRKPAQIWHLKNLGNGDVLLTNAESGQALTVDDAAGGDGVIAVQRPVSAQVAQIWHLTDLQDGGFTLTNKSTGRLLDVYASSKEPGGRIVQWMANDGVNQQWEFRPTSKP